MSLLSRDRNLFLKLLHFLGILASILLIVSISLETFNRDPFLSDSIYFKIQFWICIYFTLDFCIFFIIAKERKKFFLRYWLLLVLSIPYLTIIDYSGIKLTETEAYLIRFIPLVRGGAALVMLIAMLVKRYTTAIFVSYLVLLVSSAYFMTLIFYQFEVNVNPLVHSYGDTIWWAAMTVTTVGSNIIPITVTGKVATTILAALGLTIFPLFTAYITIIITKVSQRHHQNMTDDLWGFSVSENRNQAPSEMKQLGSSKKKMPNQSNNQISGKTSGNDTKDDMLMAP